MNGRPNTNDAFLPYQPRQTESDTGLPMVRHGPANHRLGERMDRLQTTACSHQSQDLTIPDKSPHHHHIGLANAGLKTGRETRDPTPANPKRVLPTRLHIQQSRIKAIPTATRVGPCHRAKTRPPGKHAREGVCSNPTQTRSTRNLPSRTPR
jgi:hypothetical protein